MKLIRALLAAALALGAAIAVQMATSSGASASIDRHDCIHCWEIVHE